MMLNWRSWVAFKLQPATSQWENWQWSQQEAQWNSRRAEPCTCGTIWCCTCLSRGWEPTGWGRALLKGPGWQCQAGWHQQRGFLAEGTRCTQGVGAAERVIVPWCLALVRPHLEQRPAGQGHTLEGCPGQEEHEKLGRNMKNYQNYVTYKERLSLAESGEEDAKR